MKILAGYLLKEFFKLLLFCEGVFLFLFLTVDFLEKIDNFIEANVSKGMMMIYFAYKMPFVAMSMLPPAALISVIILFSAMQKRNEVTALKASGFSVLKLCRTILAASLFIVAGVFIFSEIIDCVDCEGEDTQNFYLNLINNYGVIIDGYDGSEANVYLYDLSP